MKVLINTSSLHTFLEYRDVSRPTTLVSTYDVLIQVQSWYFQTIYSSIAVDQVVAPKHCIVRINAIPHGSGNPFGSVEARRRGPKAMNNKERGQHTISVANRGGGPVKLDSMWQHRLTRPVHVPAYVLLYNLQTKSI